MFDALVGAGVSALGGMLGGGPSMPKFRPSDVTTGLGTADWDKKGRSVTSTLSPEQQAFANLYNQQAQQYLSGNSASQGFQGFANGQVQGMFPGLFNGAMGASGVDQQSLQAYLGQMGGVAGGMQGLFGAAGQAGMGMLNSPVYGSGQANTMFGMGQGMMNTPQQSYQDVYNQRLGLLRDQAAPFEERAQNSFLNKQFAMGQMGAHTGGNRNTEAFARGLGQADTTRQLDAMNLSEALYGRDQSANIQRQGIGSGLMQGGLQGLLSGYGQQGQLAQGFMGLGGNLGTSLGNVYGAGYGAQQGMNELVNQRAQQRMSNATDLFGFGQQLGQQDLKTGATMQQMTMEQYAQLQNQAQMGMNAGAIRMGGTPIQGSNPLGAALQSFGNGIMANPGSISGMFGGNAGMFGQHNVGLTPTQLSGAFGMLDGLGG